MPDGTTRLKQVYVTKNALLKILHKELGELRGIANPRKRGDSFPVSSLEGNEEHSDSEEKLIREEVACLICFQSCEKICPALAVQNSQGSLS